MCLLFLFAHAAVTGPVPKIELVLCIDIGLDPGLDSTAGCHRNNRVGIRGSVSYSLVRAVLTTAAIWYR